VESISADARAVGRYDVGMGMGKGRRSRAMRIVPRIVFGTAFVGVVPVVASSCDPEPGCKGNGCYQTPPGVAAVAFQCFDGSTAPQCSHVPPPGVAAVAFQCFDGSTAPPCIDAHPDTGGDADGADVGDVEIG
jgi:hypothetical protein